MAAMLGVPFQQLFCDYDVFRQNIGLLKFQTIDQNRIVVQTAVY